MGFVEGVALVLAGLILAETVVFLLVPGSVLAFSKWMAERTVTLMVFYGVLGFALLYGLLQSFSLVEVVAAGTVMAIFYGVSLLPFYGALVDAFEEAREEGFLLRRIAPGLVLWVGLAVAVILDWYLDLF